MNNDETIQCVFDIRSFFAKTDLVLEDPATEADFQRLEKTIDVQLPRALRYLLQEVNGGIFFLDKRMLSTRDIREVVEQYENSKIWKHGIVPFCGDDANGYLVIDTRRDDCVREWDRDDGLGEDVADSFRQYLEQYRNNILSGKYEYLEGVGVIELSGRGRK